MSMNYVFGFSLLLLLLVALNIYFFYTLLPVSKKHLNFNVPNIKLDLSPSVFKDIYDYLNYLPSQYKNRNHRFQPVQNKLLAAFNPSAINKQNDWQDSKLMESDDSLFPYQNGIGGQILHTIKTSPIALADNAPKGTQLKLLLLLEGRRLKLYFKPKRYEQDHVIRGSIFAGFDRHNSEVFAYYLALTMNFTWIPPSVIRKVHIDKEIVPAATTGLKNTMIRNSGKYCIYGKCHYCKINDTVCPDNNGEIEGAAILYLDKLFRFQVYKSPWHRNYNNDRPMEWQKDNNFCKKVTGILTLKTLLNLIDISIFDFLIQNGDRHRYEKYKDKILLFDNGKGLGNPAVDELDILSPLYQCCVLKSSTWKHLELLSGGSLTETVKLLSAFQGDKLATEDHYKAVERRLLKVYATVQYCIGKHGSAKVFKNEW